MTNVSRPFASPIQPLYPTQLVFFVSRQIKFPPNLKNNENFIPKPGSSKGFFDRMKEHFN